METNHQRKEWCQHLAFFSKSTPYFPLTTHVVVQAVHSLYLGLVKARMRSRRHRHVFKSSICSKEKLFFHLQNFEILLALFDLQFS